MAELVNQHSLKRPVPYKPSKKEWGEIYEMLCNHCDMQLRCEVVEGMIEMKDGGEWPEGGWIVDVGGGVSCLSYVALKQEPLTPDQLQKAIDSAVPMCNGCAARKGSEASVCLHTQRDFKAAVKNQTVFFCHQKDRERDPCGGWAQAVSSKLGTNNGK